MSEPLSIDAARLAAMVAWLPAWGPGGQLLTTEGEIPLEWLATGDRVITRDAGAQPILWLGRGRLGRAALAAAPGLAPLALAPGALGPGCPGHATRLGPAARILYSGWEVEMHAGVSEALGAVAPLAGPGGPAARDAPAPTHYTFVLLPVHALVRLNGIWVESLLLDRAARRLLEGLLPAPLARAPALASGHARAARYGLAAWELGAIGAGAARGAGAGPIPRVA